MAEPPHLGNYAYTPLFCEENIWQLVRRLVADGVDAAALQVIIISNPQRQVQLFKQRNASELGYVVWDYHVILRHRDRYGDREGDGEVDRIYVFDTTHPFPCNSLDYLKGTFGVQQKVPQTYRAQLRVIPAAAYLRNFSSSREHMNGQVPQEAFPPWEIITPDHAEAVRLDEYWDMTRQLQDGSRVMRVDDFIEQEL